MAVTVTKLIPFTITDLPLIVESLLTAPKGVPYSHQMQKTGGVGPFTWSATNLPLGIVCDAAGMVSGTPTTAAAYSPTFSLVDNGQ